MSDMQKVLLDKRKAIATVETGIHVGPLVKGLARQGFMAPFGDSPTVRIGGITMGGGFGVLSRSIGLIASAVIFLLKNSGIKRRPACPQHIVSVMFILCLPPVYRRFLYYKKWQ